MAQRTEIADELNSLAVHCPHRLMDVEAKSMWMRDWCEDLAEYPIEAIRSACRKWRHSGATKFPTPGQLIPLVREVAPVEGGGKVEVWRELNDAEYDALSIREKIRHRQILAMEARRKAGPMFRNSPGEGIRSGGIHLKPEDMPDVWRKWTKIAEAHEAEASRLRHLIRNKPMAAE